MNLKRAEATVATATHEIASNGAEAARSMPMVSVVVPTRNEAANIDALVSALEQVAPETPMEILFVDDSTDETPRTIAAVRRRRRLRRITLIHRPAEERGDGLGGAVVRGIRAARAPWVCVMDADFQHPPEAVARLVDRARLGDVDVVVGSRYIPGGAAPGLSAARSLVSRATGLAARLLFPLRLRNVTDPMSGFFLVRREALALDALKPRGFKILLEILIRSPRLRVGEVAYSFGTRAAGESKAGLREGLLFLAALVRLRVAGNKATAFAVVGATGLVVNSAAFALLTAEAHLQYLVAALVATQISSSWNFVLLERWAFATANPARSLASRAATFFAINNVLLGGRGPMLVLFVSVLAFDPLAANILTIVLLFVLRFGAASSWIWAERDAAVDTTYRYSVHGIASVESPVALPELERFRVDELDHAPTIRVRVARLSRHSSRLVHGLLYMTRHHRYDEGLGVLGFGVDIFIGRTTTLVVSPLVARSPHVLYTNVVEPTLRWTLVKKGYALAHGACIAFGNDAYLITARTDTGKTTTILRMLDNYRCSFLSDDLTIVSPDGTVLTYPKPLTISRHTAAAVRTPLLSRFERLALVFQSRIHSRSGRQFAQLIAHLSFPAATINAVTQFLVPPPKYHVDRLVPGVELKQSARLRGMFVIERGGEGDLRLDAAEAVETLLQNTDDAYGFPPYPSIEHFLHSGNGRKLRVEEREIIAAALGGLPTVVLRSRTMDWYDRLPALVGDGKPSGRRPSVLTPVPEAVTDFAFD
jgi:glycosyltransferase involved in cell wall biosynthesis